MFKCGVSKEKITPEESLIPDLYALMGRKFAGVIEDLYVRILAIEDSGQMSLLISAELDKSLCPDVVIPSLADRFGIPKENILYFGVHTHTAPLHGERLNEGPNARCKKTTAEQEASKKYEKFVIEKIIQAADEAVGSMVPARLGWALGESFIGENRCQDYWVEDGETSENDETTGICEALVRDGSSAGIRASQGLRKVVGLGYDPKGDCDPTLFVMKAETLDGRPIAFFINHAVHCCVMILNNFDGKGGVGIGPDLAGEVSRLVEAKWPGSVALWSSGAAGNINPKMMNQFYYADEITGEIKEFTDIKSDETARLMLMLLSHRQAADVVTTVRNINCDMEDGEISGAERLVTCEGAEGPYEVNLRAVKIGGIAFVGASGELYSSLGGIIQDEGQAAGVDKTVVINHESSLLYDSGYIFDDETMKRCLQEDGSIQGELPGMRHMTMKIGTFAPALKVGAGKIFEDLKRA